MKVDTMDQLEKFSSSLQEKLKSGDLSLLDEIKKSQLEIQAIVKKSFDIEKLKEGLQHGEVSSIRDKIEILQRDFNLNRILETKYVKDKLTLINNLMDLKTEVTLLLLLYLKIWWNLNFRTAYRRRAKISGWKHRKSEFCEREKGTLARKGEEFAERGRETDKELI